MLLDASSVYLQQPLQPAFFSPLRQGQAHPEITLTEPPHPTDLRAALRDLDGLSTEASEDGFPQPSCLALTNARRLLQDLYRLRPFRMEVYPTPDGEVALVVPGGHRRSVLVLCGSKGSVLCSVNLNGRHRRASYEEADTLPDRFVREAVRDLDNPDWAR